LKSLKGKRAQPVVSYRRSFTLPRSYGLRFGEASSPSVRTSESLGGRIRPRHASAWARRMAEEVRGKVGRPFAGPSVKTPFAVCRASPVRGRKGTPSGGALSVDSRSRSESSTSSDLCPCSGTRRRFLP